jgi:hypothetical protein
VLEKESESRTSGSNPKREAGCGAAAGALGFVLLPLLPSSLSPRDVEAVAVEVRCCWSIILSRREREGRQEGRGQAAVCVWQRG